MALDTFDRIAAPIRLNVNVSPATIASAGFFDAIADTPSDRLVVEVTEHAVIDDYDVLRPALRRLATSGVSLAIDDVGMGSSGLDRILHRSSSSTPLSFVTST